MIFKNFFDEIRRSIVIWNTVISLILDIIIDKLVPRENLATNKKLLRRFFGYILKITINLLRSKKTTGSFPQQFRETLERLGPTYVKLGQILSLRHDILPDAVISELKKLHNQVPPFPFAQVKQIIESEFKKPLHILFQSINQESLATGSLAQAHIAYLKNGQRVILKIQRPGIRQIIESDIKVIKRFTSFLDKIPFFKAYHLYNFIERFEKFTMEELNFLNEGKNAETFTNNFKKRPRVIFPKIYWKYSSPKVLTMEFIDGIKPDDLEAMKAAGINPKAIASAGAKAIIQMLFEDGFFHGDPHPGNMMIAGTDTIVFLDLGITGHFSKKTRENLFLYFFFLVTKDYDHATKYLLTLSHTGPNADVEQFSNNLKTMMSQITSFKLHDASFGKLTMQIMKMAADQDIHFSNDLVLSTKALVTIESVANILDPDLDLAEVSKPFLQEVFAKQFSPEEVFKTITQTLPEYLIYAKNLPKTVLNSLNLLSAGKLQVEVPKQDPIEYKTGNSNNITLSAAFFICASMFSISEKIVGPSINLFDSTEKTSLIAVVFFVLAVLFLLKNFFSSTKN